MAWTEQPIFFIDFEGNRVSGVLEYGVVEIRGGGVIATHTRLCGAIGEVRPEDVAVHGIASSEVAGKPEFAGEWDFFAGLRDRGPFAAHFAGVENALLKAVWPYPRNTPDFARPGQRAIEWGPWVDTARLYQQLYPTIGSAQLEALVAACGLQRELDEHASRFCPATRRHYHAALYDALAGALLLISLAREPRLAALSVMQLLALSTLDPDKRDALQQRELFEG